MVEKRQFSQQATKEQLQMKGVFLLLHNSLRHNFVYCIRIKTNILESKKYMHPSEFCLHDQVLVEEWGYRGDFCEKLL